MERSNITILAAVTVLGGGVFLVDLLVPLGVAVWLPYVGIVLLSLWFPSRWHSYATTAACTALMLVGLFLPPERTGLFWMAAVNRLLGAAALWITAIVGLAARRTLELQESNRKLQEEIIERERLQAQLLRSQRLESIGVLAGGIAHDFNNLLTPILMAAKLLKEDRIEEERQDLLATLQASAERGAEMVRQLLAFAGGSDGQRQTIQPSHVIKEIKAILEHTVPKTIYIQARLSDNLKPIHADATQLSQVLMNLCINARDAMPSGGALSIQADNVVLSESQCRLHPGTRPGAYVLIEVTDSGVGIPADVLDKVFDPFFTTKGPSKGTGLGLSTALGIVRGHGGFINAYSEVGKGSRFAVYLPVGAEAQPPPAPLSPTAHSTSEGICDPPRGHGELILVVDDEPLIRETARSTLESRGYRVVTATDGKEAVDLYQQRRHEIQVVLLDMMMPGMDGQAALAALEELNPKVRVIASSGLRVGGRVAQAIAAGRGALLPKPYSDAQILATLAAVLNQDQGER